MPAGDARAGDAAEAGAPPGKDEPGLAEDAFWTTVDGFMSIDELPEIVAGSTPSPR